MFNLVDERGSPYNASGCTAYFAISDYVNQGLSSPYISKTGYVLKTNVFVGIDAEETARLPQGKFRYQLTLQDRSGNIEIPAEGFVVVKPNINPDFFHNDVDDSIIHF